jgi:glycosyltransferase involved in cell wall biosynthesis
MSLDIVFPAHDEEHRIDRTLTAYRSGFPREDVRFHLALDGCRDRTAELVRRHGRADRRVVLHEFPKLGKGGVLMETFRRCRGDAVGFVDADCATPPAELARMVDDLDASSPRQPVDGVIASRRLPASVTPGRRPAARAVTSTAFAWMVRRVFDLPYADTQCGAKVLHRRVTERVVPLLSSRDFLFDVDLLLTASRLGFRIIEVPTVWIDQRGSKLHTGRDAARMLAGTARLWVHHHTLPIEAPTDPIAPLVEDQARPIEPVAGDTPLPVDAAPTIAPPTEAKPDRRRARVAA